eukprot:CAMPEP_0114430020 /NCGR_PEP_ID=MMETSP0103-20121206/9810_1 /TAXON_ID=37642 ORGANISM="Paraphysomonas imperforata, Strain PA2" /NCGR_SAMPLE_ID=MMETSP0103 /ASSEMBLY_ACC=CAM_ASM_000201 /LENGTH=388 /DNA_ID=CAMNT_0001599423 /DNA_START=251 /DNA_END=1418 /DNA_ORIENTATION=+
MTTGEEVAIKLETIRSKHPQLLRETKIYRSLHGSVGIPSVRWFGVEGDYNVMIIDLLGRSLEDLFNDCGRLFHLKTVLTLADQLLCRLDTVHTKCYIHRDIKPDNFLMGRGGRRTMCYVIDFGLSKLYRDPRNHRHIPYREGKNLTGTARYASINTHMGIEQSRRDDLESLGYVLMYFLRGSLPWQGLKANTKKQKYERILEKKAEIPTEVLCKGFPAEFRSYFDHVRSLHFDDRPDYDYLKRMFRELFFRKGFRYDNFYDWDLSERDRLAPEYTTGVEGIEPALNPRGGGQDHDQSKRQDEKEEVGAGQEGDKADQSQPVVRILSRGDRSSSQVRSTSQQLQNGSSRHVPAVAEWDKARPETPATPDDEKWRDLQSHPAPCATLLDR